MRYLPETETRRLANIVVDGAPNAATVLTLSHWPGITAPPGLARDLSAEMAFAYLDQCQASGEPMAADVVTNNHFDQDGLVGIFALIEPDVALEHREVLVDVANVGDFARSRFRNAELASMALATLSDRDRSPIANQLGGGYEEQCGVLYRHALDLLGDLVVTPERYEALWIDEATELESSRAALAAGQIEITELPELDLAIVDVDRSVADADATRFAAIAQTGVHPLAINNATEMVRILEVHGSVYRYTDRYETWVQYETRRPLRRVDLRPLAVEFDHLEPAAMWSATAPSVLLPRLRHTGDSELSRQQVVDRLTDFLAKADTAWDPYAAQQAAPT